MDSIIKEKLNDIIDFTGNNDKYGECINKIFNLDDLRDQLSKLSDNGKIVLKFTSSVMERFSI